MTAVYITIDTEYAANLPGCDGPGSRAENFARSIRCDTTSGPVGTGYQMDVMDRHGVKGVFFVDPMPALLWGVAAIEDVVGPIVARGHDVQLHCHTEWLALAGDDRVRRRLAGNLSGQHIKNFPFEEQCRILEWARDTLVAAGAPPPIVFRAGNYGANDDTLRALAAIGVPYDTSHAPALAGRGDCAISLGADVRRPVLHHGVVELPIACIEDFGGRLRHGQITALTLAEMVGMVEHAQANGIGAVTLVSHSFELMSRDRVHRNRVVARRFDGFCRALGTMTDSRSATYAMATPDLEPSSEAPVMAFNPLVGSARLAEQAVSNVLYASNARLRAKQSLLLGLAMLSGSSLAG